MLLKAALLPPEHALEAWEEWKKGGDLDRLDPGSQRLLPQLFMNLRGGGAEDPMLESLRDLYRKTWVKNRLLFRNLAALLRSFRSASIDTLLLKGAALIPLAYRDYGCRPMTDLDLVVPQSRAAAAIELLQGLGWSASLDFPETLIGIRHAQEFVDARGVRVDLHWNVLQECCGPGESDDFWEEGVAIDVQGVPTRALCPADQLLQVCVHGARSTPVQPVNWIADATVVLSSTGDQLDWRRLLVQTDKRRLTVPMRDALEYLHTKLNATIPREVLETLMAARSSRFERLEFRVKASRRELVGTLPVLWFDYWRVSPHGSVLRRALGFPGYLRLTFRVRTLAGLPLAMVTLAMRRVKTAIAHLAGKASGGGKASPRRSS